MNDVVVDLSPQPIEAEGIRVTQVPGGGVEVDLSPKSQAGAYEPAADEENLAEKIDPSKLSTIAEKLIEMVEADEESRKDWFETYKVGLKTCGAIKGPDTGAKPPFKGAATLVHPLIIEAATQFQARAIAELFPATGPVKTVVLGESSEELEQRRKRVESHMNYQVMKEDRGYFWDLDSMLFHIGFCGSTFKKHLWDEGLGYTRSRYVHGQDLIVSYQATSLEDAPRITHRMRMTHNDLLKKQHSGFYLSADKVALQIPPPESDADTPAAASDGTTPTDLPEDGMHEVYETSCDWDLPGFEDVGEDGKPTGIGLPYIISVETYSRRVLSIRRNWKEEDPKKRKRLWWTHYKLLPGLGFYGWGFIHAIGGLGEAATGAVRALLDSAAFSNVPGGFRSAEAKVMDNDVSLEPGVFKATELTGDDLRKAFYVPDFGEPSEALFKLLGIIVEAGNRFAATTDEMVGAGDKDIPVGTTVARIEQGSRVYSAIHKRLHQSTLEEYALRGEINFAHLDDQGSDFQMEGSTLRIYKEDYGPPIDILPVSDPNVYSTTQRVAIAQGLVQRADMRPNLYDSYEVERRYLQALRVPDIDRVLIDPHKIEPCDPVSEGALVMTGKPIRAFPEQDHQAHLIVHQGQIEMLAGTPLEKMAGPALMAHIAEHYAQQYRMEMSVRIGVPLPELPLRAGERKALPPQLEQQISQAAAMATQQMLMERDQASGVSHQQQMAGLELKEKELSIAKMGAEVEKLRSGEGQAEAQAQQQEMAQVVNDIREEMAKQVEKIRVDADTRIRRAEEAMQMMKVEQANRSAEIQAREAIESRKLDSAREERERASQREQDQTKVRDETTAVLADFGKQLTAMLKVAQALESAVKERAEAMQGGNMQIEGMDELVKGVQQTVALVRDTQASVAQSQQQLAGSLNALASELGKPTELVTDKAGKPVGSRKVDKLKGSK